ncbi:SPW repeat domain-containing protein [Bradyrhizobium retamae]|uniref:SPW repeat-containing integral membrane domain-containing protein n=1 Tax=Bradyrhizobium retamae TaxID=1300035 RepID=A0A0R3MKL9_9BRAD|nr:hypothetical protein [Bradyrhizobium retamae]KRR20490.1 hypothetical protein CQ13_32370 [Bradyrhizobium retamae]
MVTLETGARKQDAKGRHDLVNKVCDASNLLVGAGLFLSPWLLGFGAPTPNVPSQSAGVSGTFIGILSFSALYAFEVWEEWLILIVAVGALASPWIFNFGGLAMAAHLCAGALSLLLVMTRLGLWSRMLSRDSQFG